MAEPTASRVITELKVTAHLMRLDTGVFCIVQTPGAKHEPDAAGLPGVRVTLPPNAAEDVTIASFRPDGWLSGPTDAAVVRVSAPTAQLLVTIYQNIASTDPAPRLQVIRLNEDTIPQPGQAPRTPPAPVTPRSKPEIVAHVQVKGDIGAMMGEWIGERGSKRWIEGFMIVPQGDLAATDIEYQAVLGRGWLSPWSEGGNLCGSRGMSLPILGLRLRLKGDAAEKYDVSYEASFIDGTEVKAESAGAACEAESLSPLEAFKVTVAAKAKAGLARPGRAAPGAPPTAPLGAGPKALPPKPAPRKR